MALCLAMVLVFTACGSGGNTGNESAGGGNEASGGDSAGGGDTGGRAWHIGYADFGTDWMLVEFNKVSEQVVKAENPDGKWDSVPCDYQADKMQSAIQNLIAAGVDGINYYPVFTTQIPTILEMCDSANIPVAMGHTPIPPENIDACLDSKMFAGFVGVDVYNIGYQLGEQAAKDGGTKAIIVAGLPGSWDMVTRIEGFTDGFESGGGQVLESAYTTHPSEVTAKTADLLNANPEADTGFATVDAHMVGMMAAVKNAGKDMLLYTGELDGDLLDSITKGELMAGVTGSPVEMIMAQTLLQNALNGTPILDENGKAPMFNKMIQCLVTKENAAEYKAQFIDQPPFSENMINNFLSVKNPDLTYKDYEDFFANYNYEWFIEYQAENY